MATIILVHGAWAGGEVWALMTPLQLVVMLNEIAG